MKRRTSGLIAMSVLGISHSAAAQDEGKIEAGAFDIIPSVTSEAKFIDNVTYASNDEETIESWVGVISPRVRALTRFGNSTIEASYRLERGEYFSSDADNYTDHFANLTGRFDISSRHRFTARARYEDGHDERGRRFSNGFGNQLANVDTYKNSGLDAIYSFGALSSDGRIDVSVGVTDLDYDWDQGSYLFRDRQTKKVGGQFYYRLAGSTHLVFDATHRQIDYDVARDPANPLDSDENRLLAGVTWESTASTTSFAKVGYQQKKFDAGNREDFSGVDWEVGMTWQPLSYTEFGLSTSADTRETNGEGDFIRSRDYAVSWKHAWLQRFSTKASLIYEEDDYEAAIVNPREDDTTRLLLSADYDFRRWLTLGLYYQLSERDSNRPTIEYDRDVVGLTARVTL